MDARVATALIVIWGLLFLVLDDKNKPKMLAAFLLLLPVGEARAAYATYYTVASCKAEGTSGVRTASGERYDETAFTCAMRCRTWGAKYIVRNEDTRQTIVVRLNDFGPGRKATANGVIIDLTPAAYTALGGDFKRGRLRVTVRSVNAVSIH